MARVITNTSASRARRRRCRSSHLPSRPSSSRITPGVSRVGRTGSLAPVQRLGAIPGAAKEVEFRVWAPRARSLAVRLGGGDHALAPDTDGTWSGGVAAADGDDYLFVVDGKAWPDPCSRWQPEGVRGPSRILDTRAFDITAGPQRALSELALYELHVGTFSPEG